MKIVNQQNIFVQTIVLNRDFAELEKLSIYSETENIIGEWINGETLYRKTYNFSFPSLSLGTWNNFLTVDGATKILKVWGVVNETSPLPYIEPTQYIGFMFNGNKISVISSSNALVGKNTEFVVEYLK